jgi:FMN-dependent NADH-azoreductase
MKQILIVESSPRGPESASRKLASKIRARLEAQYPMATIVERDLVKDKLPHLDPPTLNAIFTKEPRKWYYRHSRSTRYPMAKRLLNPW